MDEITRRRGRPSSPTEHSLGRYLRALRHQRGLTVREGARAAGLSESAAGYISQLEKGLKVPSPDLAEKLGAALGDDQGILRLWSMVGRRSDPWQASSARRELARLLDDPGLNLDVRFVPPSWATIVEGPSERSRWSESRVYGAVRATEIEAEAKSRGGLIARLLGKPRTDRPAAYAVPLLEEGQDPERDVPATPEHRGYVRLDPNVPLVAPLIRPFAYRLSAEGARRVKHLLRGGDIAIITREPGPIVRHEVYAVRTDGQVVLSEVIWNQRQLLLLPAPDASDFRVLDVPEGAPIEDLVLGHVATVIRGPE
jgi:transcriptional regulator with XRE-family HTH domain